MPGGDGTGPRGQGPIGGFAGGRGRMGGPIAGGPEGKCRCPECGFEAPHYRGQPCNNTKCPKCGNTMIRV